MQALNRSKLNDLTTQGLGVSNQHLAVSQTLSTITEQGFQELVSLTEALYQSQIIGFYRMCTPMRSNHLTEIVDLNDIAQVFQAGNYTLYLTKVRVSAPSNCSLWLWAGNLTLQTAGDTFNTMGLTSGSLVPLNADVANNTTPLLTAPVKLQVVANQTMEFDVHIVLFEDGLPACKVWNAMSNLWEPLPMNVLALGYAFTTTNLSYTTPVLAGDDLYSVQFEFGGLY